MKKTVTIILLLIFISITSSVYAVTSKIALEPSVDLVEKGKTFTVTIKGQADSNITALQANLSYDTNKLSVESKAAGTGFSDLSSNNEIAVSATSGDNLSKSVTLYTITFKVLDAASEGDTKIAIENAVMALINDNGEQENTEESSSEIVVKINSKATTPDNKENGNTGNNNTGNNSNQNNNDGNDNNENNNNGSNNNPNNGNNNNENNNNVNNNSKNNIIAIGSTNNKVNTNKNQNQNMPKNITELPKAGYLDDAGKIKTVAIILFGAIAIVSYILYRKYKKY